MTASRVIGLGLCLMVVALSAQEKVEPELSPEKKAAQARLDYMFDSCAGYTGKRKSDGAIIKIFPKPLLRWTNPNFGVRDGLFVAWVDEKKRPMAAGQVFLMPKSENEWYIEQQSLCDDAMEFHSRSNSAWTPSEPGIQWRTFPAKRYKPARSKPLRLTQMRQLARRFRGQDDLVDKDDELRLMPNPMVRYEDLNNGILDGALFALVQGTDPELLVQIEVREEKAGAPEYWWAIAPMTSAKASAFLDDEQVYSKPRDLGSTNSVFYMRSLTGGVPFPEVGVSGE